MSRTWASFLACSTHGLLTSLLAAQAAPAVALREAEVDKQVAPLLVAFARSAETYKAPSHARAVFEQILDHYDYDNAGARTGLGYKRVKGEWQLSKAPDQLPADTATPAQLRLIETARQQTWQRVIKLHRDLGLALLAEGVDGRGRYQLERALAFDPDDRSAHKALGHEELDGFFGAPEQIAFVQRMRAIAAVARELSGKDFPVEHLSASVMPSELKQSGLPFHGVRSRNFTHWVIGEPAAAASTILWAERSWAMLDYLLGPQAQRRFRPQARKWLAILRTDAERDTMLQASPNMRHQYTLEQARMLGGVSFKTGTVWAEYTCHALENDADHCVAHVAQRCWTGNGNPGLSEGFVHTMTWLLCGTTISSYCSLPSTVSGNEGSAPPEPRQWLARLFREIATGQDWPLAQVPRERLDNFRDNVRIKAWSFVLWLLARYPDRWTELFDAMAKDKLQPEDVTAAFVAVLERDVGDVEAEWREWAREGSRIGKASGLGR